MSRVIIGIPTYNRPDLCISTANNVLEVVKDLSDVSVLVVDNSEAPNNELHRLSEMGKFSESFDYIKNEENLGLDGSILKLCKIAKSKKALLWFLCDDDEIYEKSVLSFLSAIIDDNSPVKLCQFGFKTSLPMGSNGFWRTARTEDYLRASFLPTVCIDTNFYNEGQLKELIGCNYIHIAIINQMVTEIKNISVYECLVGSQNENIIPTFSIADTFINGYMKALNHKKLLTLKKIKSITYYRLRGYLGRLLKNYLLRKNDIQVKLSIYSLATTINQKLGTINLLFLFPRLFTIYIFTKL